jgi:hypothetical protein
MAMWGRMLMRVRGKRVFERNRAAAKVKSKEVCSRSVDATGAPHWLDYIVTTTNQTNRAASL